MGVGNYKNVAGKANLKRRGSLISKSGWSKKVGVIVYGRGLYVHVCKKCQLLPELVSVLKEPLLLSYLILNGERARTTPRGSLLTVILS